MMRTFYSPNERKLASKTAKPMFRRLDQNMNTQDSRLTRTSKQSRRNFPSLNKSAEGSLQKSFSRTMTLDNSKENLMFESYLKKVNSTSRFDEKVIVSNYLNVLRKDYDKMHKQIKEQMSQISLKKKDIDFIKERAKVQQENIESIQKKIEIKAKQVEAMQAKHEHAVTQRKTLDQIISRMKKDQLFYKQFGRVEEGHVIEKKRQMKALNECLILEDEKIHKLVMQIQEMKGQFVKNQEFRERKLGDYCDRIENIHEKDAFIQERRDRTNQLHGIESNDILKQKNVEMHHICLINKVANCIFENKIQSLIDKYSKVQEAYHTIQSKTSMSDPNLIANKFFSYEELTQNLLKSISSYERQVNEKTEKNKVLKAKYKAITESIYNSEGVEEQQTRKFKHQQIMDEFNETHLIYERIKSWINRMAHNLKICGADDIQDSVKKLSQICVKAKTEIYDFDKTSLKSEKKYVTPGIRIKKVIKESTIDSKTQKLKELQEIKESIVTEEEYLKAARAGVKRNFLIKQKTVNLGNLQAIREAKIENLSERKNNRSLQSHKRP